MKTDKITELEKSRDNLYKSKIILLNIKNSNTALAIHHIDEAIEMIEIEMYCINYIKNSLVK